MNKDEALKMAIEYIENQEIKLSFDNLKAKADALNACKEALEQPEPRLFLDLSGSNGNHPVNPPAQEPVARIKQGDDGYPKLVFNGVFKYESISIKQPDIPLYTHPHQWQELTDDEIKVLVPDAGEWHCEVGVENAIDFARAIEQALKENNHD